MYPFILFLFSPFISVVYALRNLDKSQSKWLLIAFFGFFGYYYGISQESSSSDIVRYIKWFYEMRQSDFTLSQLVSSFYKIENNIDDKLYADVTQPLFTFLISRITGKHEILIAFYGLFFGFFLTENIIFMFKRLIGSKNDYVVSLSIMLLFTFSDFIWEINGFRFMTASQVFVYGVLKMLEGKRWNGAIALLSTPLIHFSFLLPVFVFLTFLLIRTKINFLFILFVSTTLFSQFDLISIFNNYSNYLPDIFIERSDSYIEQGALNNKSSQGVWYARYFNIWFRWAISLIISGVFINHYRKISNSENIRWLLGLVFILYSMSNLASNASSGARFYLISNMLALCFLMIFVCDYRLTRTDKSILVLSSPFLLLFFVVQMRIGFYNTNLMIFIGSPVWTFLGNVNLALNDFIK